MFIQEVLEAPRTIQTIATTVDYPQELDIKVLFLKRTQRSRARTEMEVCLLLTSLQNAKIQKLCRLLGPGEHGRRQIALELRVLHLAGNRKSHPQCYSAVGPACSTNHQSDNMLPLV